MRAFIELSGVTFRASLVALALAGSLVVAGAPASAQTGAIDAGVGFLQDRQDPDGGWSSTQVRAVQATTEALRALQETGRGPAARSAAADHLALGPVADNDDRARRIEALAIEGRGVATLVADLVAQAQTTGGWGLTPGFDAGSLDTALSLDALVAAGQSTTTTSFLGLVQLVGAQRPDGGWGCAPFGESEPACTAQALLTLDRFETRSSSRTRSPPGPPSCAPASSPTAACSLPASTAST